MARAARLRRADADYPGDQSGPPAPPAAPAPLDRMPAPRLMLLLVALFFSLLPDIDVIPALLTGDMLRFHNQWTHSLVVGAGVALASGLAGWRLGGSFRFWFLLALVSYEIHILMDLFTGGPRGVMLFWPLTSARYEPPFRLFRGLHWSEGLWSVEHIYTFGSELLFAALLWLAAVALERLWKMRSS